MDHANHLKVNVGGKDRYLERFSKEEYDIVLRQFNGNEKAIVCELRAFGEVARITLESLKPCV